MSEIEAVVFDIGNVLVEWHPERPFDRVLGEAERRRLFAEVDLEGMNRAVDLGAPFAESVEALAARHPERADAIRLWRECWMEMFAPVIEGSVALLRALRAAGVPVYALSNFGPETFEMAEAAYPFLREFDRRFISGRLGVMKPDAAIYEMLEQETGHAPSRLLFIDDRPENIAAAEARGWQGHLFTGSEGVARRLREAGLAGMEDVQ
ncbi:2-haloacid dehalogenase [Meinhardsimonia xiamenensis]|jgi:2-haloacid dehalogenase|uniref:2-haloacid dehalogenase n=1 Tax=Meinhardsimonia xiamenensis TaxID=990712 RepID=A0A1G9DUP3_9RHOB|nr:HAD family phosphatase [Meinhardsimonia xiamenensis]PRX31192.1 2-haloacid dehalogenase [Meinhardsimonia xiamenensis]SDK67585.1 2-haloacid dehalogenase [Meinhardsimonia xiamenensis]